MSIPYYSILFGRKSSELDIDIKTVQLLIFQNSSNSFIGGHEDYYPYHLIYQQIIMQINKISSFLPNHWRQEWGCYKLIGLTLFFLSIPFNNNNLTLIMDYPSLWHIGH